MLMPTNYYQAQHRPSIDRFSLMPRREFASSSYFSGSRIQLFKSDKLYNGMISELFKTPELRAWRGHDREDLQKVIVNQMNKLVERGQEMAVRQIPGEKYEIRCKAGSQ